MNPFDDDSAEFLVLRNQLNQHSLWPTFRSVPTGWETVFGPALRPVALEYVEANWTDIRPQTVSQQANG